MFKNRGICQILGVFIFQGVTPAPKRGGEDPESPNSNHMGPALCGWLLPWFNLLSASRRARIRFSASPPGVQSPPGRHSEFYLGRSKVLMKKVRTQRFSFKQGVTPTPKMGEAKTLPKSLPNGLQNRALLRQLQRKHGKISEKNAHNFPPAEEKGCLK